MFFGRSTHKISAELLPAMRRRYQEFERNICTIEEKILELRKSNLIDKGTLSCKETLELIESMQRDASEARYGKKSIIASIEHSDLMEEFLDTCDDKDEKDILIDSMVDNLFPVKD